MYPSYTTNFNYSLISNNYLSKYGTTLDHDYKTKYDSTLGYDYKTKYYSTLGYDYKTKYDSTLDSDYKTKYGSTLGYNYKTKYDSTLGYDYKTKYGSTLDDDYKIKYESIFSSNNYKQKNDFSHNHDFKHKPRDSKFKRSIKYDHDYKHRNFSSSQKNIYNPKTKPSYPLSEEDKRRQKIAKENKKIVESNRFHIDKLNVDTIRETDHMIIQSSIGHPTHKHTPIYIENTTTIGAAISNHNLHSSSQICILNFADAIKAGGGYLNGRGAQEETLCRQTLLYPTIVGNDMYDENKRHGNKETGSDIMIYSPNVYVIRDDFYNKISNPFKVNIISSPAVDNRNFTLSNSQKIMEKRIRKIVLLAASKRNDILILGAFGCGVFKNDPHVVAQIFKKVLKEEGLKDHFSSVIFPIKDSRLSSIFKSTLNS